LNFHTYTLTPTQVNFGLVDASGYADLDTAKAMVDAGQLVPHIQQAFPLAKVKDAFNVSQGGNVVGKLAITM
jgi:NADPH:quinone reductase-like Zn-dependent oxidoreductase